MVQIQYLQLLQRQVVAVAILAGLQQPRAMEAQGVQRHFTPMLPMAVKPYHQRKGMMEATVRLLFQEREVVAQVR